jgi:phage repressor protein C with HTH and peptisase S24 domain
MSDLTDDIADEGDGGEVASRIREVVRSEGSKAALAAKTGIADRTIGYLLAGQDAKLSQLRRIATATNTRLEWLATGHGPMKAGATEGTGTALSRPTSGVVAVPRYDARAAAGRAAPLDEEAPIIQRVEFSEAWLRSKLRRNPAHLVLLEVVGDSMEPTIGEGDVLMLDRSVRDLTTGRIYVLDLGGELVVKRIQRRATGALLILSDNTRYPPEEIAPADAPLRVLGEVVWHARAM